MKFNVNSYLTVTLTEAGAQRLKDCHQDLHDFLNERGKTTLQSPEEFSKLLDAKLEKSGMKYRMQGWDFMQKLGYQCGPGHPQLFETIIEFEDKDLFE